MRGRGFFSPSEKPLYARVILSENATKVLTLVFRGSKGAGKGYDTMCADLNLNGDVEDDKPIKGRLMKNWELTPCLFGPVSLDVPYNENAKGVDDPCIIRISHYQDRPGQRTGRRFHLHARIRLKHRTEEWEYSFQRQLHPVEKLSEAKPIAFAGELSLRIEAKPDPLKSGNTGIAAYLLAGGKRFRCVKGSQLPTAKVQISDDEGRIVHAEDVGLDKLTFG